MCVYVYALGKTAAEGWAHQTPKLVAQNSVLW